MLKLFSIKFLNSIVRICIFYVLVFQVSCVNNQDNSEEVFSVVEDYNEDESVEEEFQYLVEVLSDTAEVNLIDLRLAGMKASLESRKKIRLGDLYNNNELESNKALLDILNGNNENNFGEKRILIEDLNTYSHNKILIRDQLVIDALYKNINDWRIEEKIIDLIAEQQIPGFIKKFENRLLSGESYHEDDLIYWLCYHLEASVALDFFAKKIKSSELNTSYISRVLQGFNLFYGYGNQEDCKRIESLCFEIFDSGVISSGEYNSLGDDYDYGNPARELLELIFKINDERAFALANHYKDNETIGYSALRCLIRFEGNKHKQVIIDQMKDIETYMDGLGLVSDLYRAENDDRIIISALTNFERLYKKYLDYENYELTEVILEIHECVGDSTVYYIEKYVKHDKIKQDLMEVAEFERLTFTELTNYLVDSDLIDQPIDSARIYTNGVYSNADLVYSILEASNAYFWIDYDDLNVIIDFHKITQDFRKHSRSLLANFKIGVEYSEVGTSETEFIAKWNEKAYRMYVPKVEQTDLIYLDQTIYFINYILRDQGIKKQFIDISQYEFIFATEEESQELIPKFRLTTYGY